MKLDPFCIGASSLPILVKRPPFQHAPDIDIDLTSGFRSTRARHLDMFERSEIA